MEGQLRLTFGMSEILVIGSIALYQYAMTYSIILLVLGIIGKTLDFALENQKRKEAEEAGREAISKVVDTVTNAVTLGNIVQGKKDHGFH